MTEAEVLANARFMAEHLLPYGWDTVVIDIDWPDRPRDPTATTTTRHWYSTSTGD